MKPTFEVNGNELYHYRYVRKYQAKSGKWVYEYPKSKTKDVSRTADDYVADKYRKETKERRDRAIKNNAPVRLTRRRNTAMSFVKRMGSNRIRTEMGK